MIKKRESPTEDQKSLMRTAKHGPNKNWIFTEFGCKNHLTLIHLSQDDYVKIISEVPGFGENGMFYELLNKGREAIS